MSIDGKNIGLGRFLFIVQFNAKSNKIILSLPDAILNDLNTLGSVAFFF